MSITDSASHRRTQLAIANAQKAQMQTAAQEKEEKERELYLSTLKTSVMNAVFCRESAGAALGSLLLIPLSRSLLVAPAVYFSYCVAQTYRSFLRA